MLFVTPAARGVLSIAGPLPESDVESELGACEGASGKRVCLVFCAPETSFARLVSSNHPLAMGVGVQRSRQRLSTVCGQGFSLSLPVVILISIDRESHSGVALKNGFSLSALVDFSHVWIELMLGALEQVRSICGRPQKIGFRRRTYTNGYSIHESMSAPMRGPAEWPKKFHRTLLYTGL